MTLYQERLNRDFENTDKNSKVQEAYMKVLDQNSYLNEDATANAKKTLDAILGSLKGDDKNDIYKMAMGMKKSYEKNKGFSKDQANWIYKTSKAMFK
jgi:hypothetical protein